ncbi:GGDEF domain-containing protein [Aliarcobacter cryaerophilus]|jgi:diguanylate cyclase (GGDEF)-like protein|uniref:GGDEF domain-containing protein n=1 Tax=Aliarcobacter cryaerophilus TaxID=28198 RepID=UPI0021B66ED8|nr:GGDEF domain-containing protein [Aliarcobacter cryaerophilus]MCT7473635.1 GGDEF domain-containing protein [Aliarcobacter cryaerophilus]
MEKKEHNQVNDVINLEKSELYMAEIYNIIDDKEKISQYEKKYKNRLYYHILLSLTHKSFNEKESKNLFEAILKHKKSLDEILNRDVGISVATLDYLQNIKKLFHYPTIVEESTSDFLTDSTTKDGLTNLYVRDVLDIFLRKEIDNAKRQNSYVSFMLIDIDDFKKVNDTYGHQKGDEVLEKIGEILNNSSRKMDFAARYGGEELCLVLPNTKSDKAYEIATRIREKIKSFIFDDFFVTVSIGISQSDENINDEIKLIRKADKALYKAKENGKDQVVIF